MNGAEDLEVCWTGAIETAEAKAQQQPASPTRPRDRHRLETVVAFLAVHPWTTQQKIAAALGFTVAQVNDRLWTLKQQGRVVQSHRQRERRGHPIRWALA